MRTYLPLTPEELLDTVPPQRAGVTAVLQSDMADEAKELAYEEALESAAFLSLERVVAADSYPSRVVAVGVVDGFFSDWKQVDSFHVDDEAAAILISGVKSAQDQESLDQAVDELFSLSLDWFDVSELPTLRARMMEERP